MFKHLFILFVALTCVFSLKAQELDSFEKELQALEKGDDNAIKRVEALDSSARDEFISDSVSVGNAAPLRPEVKVDEEAMSVLINQESPPAKKSRRIRSR